MRILVVGAGAIGGPVVLALASAAARDGSGTISVIRVCDADRVELSNLQRQVQFTSGDIGAVKAERLAVLASRFGVPLEPRDEMFRAETADHLMADVDLVIDGSDSFACKFLVGDVARAAGIPAIIASASGERGQLFVSVPPGPCYRCLFEAPPATETGSCAQVGVLAAMPGWVAGAAARAAIAIAFGEPVGPPLTIFPSAAAPPRLIDFAPRVGCTSCAADPDRVPNRRQSDHGNRSNPNSTPHAH